MREKLPIVSLSLISAILYAAGFVVTNAYLAAFAPVGFDLIRGRYLAAGLLYGMVVGPSVAVTWLGVRGAAHSLSHPTRSGRRNRLHAAGNMVGGFMSALLYPTALFGLVAVDDAWSLPTLLLCVALPSLMVLVWPLTRGVDVLWHREHPAPRELFLYATLGLVLFALIPSASVFGARLYPHASQSFGGGASWTAKLSLASPLAEEGDTVTTLRAALIDVAEDHVSLVACPLHIGGEIVPLTIAQDRVAAIAVDFGGAVALRRLSDLTPTCRRRRSGPR